MVADQESEAAGRVEPFDAPDHRRHLIVGTGGFCNDFFHRGLGLDGVA